MINNRYSATNTVKYQDGVRYCTVSVVMSHLQAYSTSGSNCSLIILFRDAKNCAERAKGVPLNSIQCDVNKT